VLALGYHSATDANADRIALTITADSNDNVDQRSNPISESKSFLLLAFLFLPHPNLDCFIFGYCFW
jgi:hypothetical protein